MTYNINGYEFKTEPKKHQLDCWLKNRDLKNFAILWEMGTGKTKLIIDTAGYLFNQGHINGVFVTVYKQTYLNWVDEFKKHLSDSIMVDYFVWNQTSIKQFVNFIASPRFTVFVMNIEAMTYEEIKAGGRLFRRYNDAALMVMDFLSKRKCLSIVDESTAIKNPKAKRTKICMAIRDLSVATRILTGSLVDERPLDCWSQFEFLKAGILGHSSFFTFKICYAATVDTGIPIKSNNPKFNGRYVQKIVGYRNLDRLREKISRHATIVKKSDCLDLPPKIYLVRYIDLHPEQKRLYAQMRRDCLVELAGQIITARLVLVQLLRLHQIVCGFINDKDGIEHLIPNYRMEALESVLEESHHCGVIWSRYKTCIKEVQNKLTVIYGTEAVASYYGDTNDKERAAVKNASVRGSESSLRWLISNQQCGGFGNTWTKYNLVIYYANSFSAELRNQSEDRCHRIGQTESVTYVDIITRGTVDEKIYKALRDKKELSSIITESNWKELFE